MSLKSKIAKALYGKSSVNPEKRKIFEQADKDIQALQALKTDRTKQVEAESGVESDITKAVRERARRTRRDLAKLRM